MQRQRARAARRGSTADCGQWTAGRLLRRTGDAAQARRQHYREAMQTLLNAAACVARALFYWAQSVVLFFVPSRYKEKSVAGDVVLVTGAGSGIGRLLALRLANRGARIVTWDVNAQGENDMRLWQWLLRSCVLRGEMAVHRGCIHPLPIPTLRRGPSGSSRGPFRDVMTGGRCRHAPLPHTQCLLRNKK